MIFLRFLLTSCTIELILFYVSFFAVRRVKSFLFSNDFIPSAQDLWGDFCSDASSSMKALWELHRVWYFLLVISLHIRRDFIISPRKHDDRMIECMLQKAQRFAISFFLLSSSLRCQSIEFHVEKDYLIELNTWKRGFVLWINQWSICCWTMIRRCRQRGMWWSNHSDSNDSHGSGDI